MTLLNFVLVFALGSAATWLGFGARIFHLRREGRLAILRVLENRVNALHAKNGGDTDESRLIARLYHDLKAEWRL